MHRVTVFTPTYNRANLLADAYNSLRKQTCKDFEWLIIDDGSNDNTKAVVDSFIGENIIDIKYIFQQNRGQYFAHNTAINNAQSELFAFLDSDDYYADNTIERLLYYFDQIKDNDDFAGVAGLKANRKGIVVGTPCNYKTLNCTIIDYRYKYKIKGDRLECFKTDLIKKFPFPEFEGRFVPNALIWNRISSSRKLLYFGEIMLYYEFSADSMSKDIIRNRQSTPDAYLLHYSELSKYNIPLYYKLRAVINFWRFAPYSNIKFKEKLLKVGFFKSIICIPIGYLMSFKDLLITKLAIKIMPKYFLKN